MCGIQNRLPPRNAADFIELAENCTFLDRKLINTINETGDGHEGEVTHDAPYAASLETGGEFRDNESRRVTGVRHVPRRRRKYLGEVS